jgi:hypothetical protein
MEKQTADVISDSQYRTLKATPSERGKRVLITRVWKTPDYRVDVIGVSLTELETILKRFNGGERSG